MTNTLNNKDNEDIHAILEKSIKENYTYENGALLAKVGKTAKTYGYDKLLHGKLSDIFSKHPDRYEVKEVSPIVKYVRLKAKPLKIIGKIDLNQIPHISLTRMNEAENVSENSTDKCNSNNITPGNSDNIVSKKEEPDRKQYYLADFNPSKFKYMATFMEDPIMRTSFELTFSYLKFNFFRALKEDKVLIKDNRLIWNSSLVDKNIETIFITGNIDSTNRISVDKIIPKSHPELKKCIEYFGKLPQPVDFSKDPLRPFNSDSPISVNYRHVLIDNPFRYPQSLLNLLGVEADKNNPDKARQQFECYESFLLQFFDGGLTQTRKKIALDPSIPLKCWYKETNKLCWLVPINMGITKVEPVALILEETSIDCDLRYVAKTILTLKDAYKCARLIAPVVSNWLFWK